jgi:hypothetical protein
MWPRLALLVGLSWLAACRHAPPAPAPAEPAPAEIVVPSREGEPTVVLPVVPLGAPLFEEELGRLERWVARHLAIWPGQPLSVQPPEEVAKLRALAAAGKIREGGPSCAAPPSVVEVLLARWPGAKFAQVWADCSREPCQLKVSVGLPGQAAIAAFSAEVKEPASFAQWERAAQHLTPTAPTSLEPRTGEGPPGASGLQVAHLRAYGPRGLLEGKVDERQVQALVARCAAAPSRSPGGHLAALLVDEGGKVSRCALHEEPGGRSPRAMCVCERLAELRLDAGAPGRRLALELREAAEAPTGQASARIAEFRSSDPAITPARLARALPWMSLCYSATLLHDPVEIPVSLRVDSQGKVEALRVAGLGERHWQLGQCLEGYLRHLPLPCPTRAEAAEVELTFIIDR